MVGKVTFYSSLKKINFPKILEQAPLSTSMGIHSQLFSFLSSGHIDVDNNLPLAKAIYGSMYYIMSSLPPLNYTNKYPFQFYGLSPGGLAHGALGADYEVTSLMSNIT